MTLMEILIVVVLIALVMSSVTVGIGALTRSDLRSSCVRVMAAARFAYHRAVVRGVTTRVVFDTEKGTFSIEEAEAPVLVARGSDDESNGEGGGAMDPWQAAEAAVAENRREGPPEEVSPFDPIRGPDGKTLSRFRNQKLRGNVRVTKLITAEREYDAKSEVIAIHFFPGGLTEHAVLQFSSAAGDVYSLEIHPLTGDGSIYAEAFEPDFLEEAEVQDPS